MKNKTQELERKVKEIQNHPELFEVIPKDISLIFENTGIVPKIKDAESFSDDDVNDWINFYNFIPFNFWYTLYFLLRIAHKKIE